MKENIHPHYHKVTVVCACGASFVTGSTKKEDVIKVDICNKSKRDTEFNGRFYARLTVVLQIRRGFSPTGFFIQNL